jgi:hypothetical protein
MGAFAIDLAFAALIVMLIPAILVVATWGHYQVADLPGVQMAYCRPGAPPSPEVKALAEQVRRSPPANAQFLKMERCGKLTNFIVPSATFQVEFTRTDQPGLLFVPIPTDFSGDPRTVVFVRVGMGIFEILFLAAFVLAARFDSLGMRIVGLRVRARGGKRLALLDFIMRYAVICCVLAPVVFLPSDLTLIGLAVTCVLAAILLLPWVSWRNNGYCGLHDMLTDATVVRVHPAQARPGMAATHQSPG